MTDSLFLKNESKKTEKFKTNPRLIKLLNELKALLEPVQRNIEKTISAPRWPIGLIIGSPRSGTTVLLQWLASLNQFSYPTNFLTRFAYSPYIGALIQKMIFDPEFDFQNELSDIQSELNFESNLGKSIGALATNEFQHFLRNYMPNFDPEYLTEEQLKHVDFEGIQKGLGSIENAFQKPFVMKYLMLQFHLKISLSYLPKAVFIFTRREPLYNMQSIFFARKLYFDDEKIWWSVKPKEYEELHKMDIYHQIAGQVFFTNLAIQRELEEIPDSNKLIIEYEDFCKSPKSYYAKLVDIYKSHGYNLPPEYNGPERFEIRNRKKLSEDELRKFEQAWADFESGKIVFKD